MKGTIYPYDLKLRNGKWTAVGELLSIGIINIPEITEAAISKAVKDADLFDDEIVIKISGKNVHVEDETGFPLFLIKFQGE